MRDKFYSFFRSFGWDPELRSNKQHIINSVYNLYTAVYMGYNDLIGSLLNDCSLYCFILYHKKLYHSQANGNTIMHEHNKIYKKTLLK